MQKDISICNKNLEFYPKFSSLRFIFSWKSLQHYQNYHYPGFIGPLGSDMASYFFYYWDESRTCIKYLEMGTTGNQNSREQKEYTVWWSEWHILQSSGTLFVQSKTLMECSSVYSETEWKRIKWSEIFFTCKVHIVNCTDFIYSHI